ncbi:preprotein translocase subunit SecE [Fusibacter sp. 3D3]|uniref:preprotein translocase subunit SecE n=1 Tax=Fusibacter sp. 3D3 TaxID=1048380 RepID=UPI000852E465|nr:preprotein translocase subunit SecE [Fusibacter sp. 3D3]GAU79704.1 preprotein translocase subunit SecE [Fusibacter sp. 3D3]
MASSNVKEKKPGVGKFIKGVRSEIKKVTWPTRKDVWQYTLVVLAMCLISAVTIGVLDVVFRFLFNLLT